MAGEDSISGVSGVSGTSGSSGVSDVGSLDSTADASGGPDIKKIEAKIRELMKIISEFIKALTGEDPNAAKGGDGKGDGGNSGGGNSGGGGSCGGGGGAPPSNKSRIRGGADADGGAGGGSPGSPNGGNSGPGQTGNVTASGDTASVDANGDGKDDIRFQGPQAQQMAQNTKEYASQHKAYGDFLASQADKKGAPIEVELKNSADMGGNMGYSAGSGGQDIAVAPDLANVGNLANTITHELGHDAGLGHGAELDAFVAKNSDDAPYS
jgi:hypothetical protein